MQGQKKQRGGGWFDRRLRLRRSRETPEEKAQRQKETKRFWYAFAERYGHNMIYLSWWYGPR